MTTMNNYSIFMIIKKRLLKHENEADTFILTGVFFQYFECICLSYPCYDYKAAKVNLNNKQDIIARYSEVSKYLMHLP